MPRRPSRPVPNPFAFLWPDVSPITEEVRVEVMTKAPAIFYLAALRGLYCRIVGKDKRDTLLSTWPECGQRRRVGRGAQRLSLPEGR